MLLVQWAGSATKPPRHHPGAAYALEMLAARSVHECGQCETLRGKVTTDSVAMRAPMRAFLPRR